MKSRAVSLSAIVFVLLLVTFLTSSPAAGQPAPINSATGDIGARVKPAVEVAPTPSLMFIENAGQFSEGARFKVHGAGRAFWLADDAIWITLLEPAAPADIRDRYSQEAMMPPAEQPETPRHGVNLRLTFPGANPDAELTAFQPVDTSISYFRGNDPAKWRPDVPVWAGVQYRDLYPGLDLSWDSAGEEAGLRVICRAEDCAAALANVQLRVEGAEAVILDGEGLLIETAAGDFRLPLLSVTDAAGRPLTFAGLTPRWQGDALVAPFAVHAASFPGSAPPTNNPQSMLLYSTFLGGSYLRENFGMAVDGAGNATITSNTDDIDFPTTPGAFDNTFGGGSVYKMDVFVLRLNATGSALIYSTFLGGTDDDFSAAIALDNAGNATVTGSTDSLNFPTTPGAFDTTHSGSSPGSNGLGEEAFVTRLNATGSALLYSTFLGAGEPDYARGLALDGNGNAVITGATGSTDFPTTPGAYDTTYNGGGLDVFVTQLNSAGNALLYSTFLGGNWNDVGRSVALDGAGYAFLTGYTYSLDFPTTPGAFNNRYGGGNWDGFVARLSVSGSSLVYSTFLGGTYMDVPQSLALDRYGHAIITGGTDSSDFPTTPYAYDYHFNGGYQDVFITCLNSAGSALLYSTFLGGEDNDSGLDLALDIAGNVSVTGYTASHNFPTTADAFDSSFNGDYLDAFIARLDSTGSELVYSTFMGGNDEDIGSVVALDVFGDLIIAGQTSSDDFPVTPGAFDTSPGESQAFAARLGFMRRHFLPVAHK